MTAIRSLIRTTGAAIAASAVLFCLAPGAFAQTKSSKMEGLKLSNDQPIQIESDKLEIHDQDNMAVFTGNVKVVQGTTILQAGTMTVYYLDKGDKKGASMTSGDADIDKINVTDKVFLSSGTQQATADEGIFNMTSQTFVLKGKQVVLSEGQNVFTGCQLTVMMETGEAKLESCGGRVKIQLDPQSQKKK